jgi:hypothetical protein
MDQLPGEMKLHLSFLYGNKVIISWPVFLPNIHVFTVATSYSPDALVSLRQTSLT